MATDSAAQTKPAKLPTRAHLLCGWPLALVAVGGAIGGGLGGAAYGINVAIYKSRLPVPAKVGLNLATGTAAFLVWAIVVAGIQTAMK